MKIIKTKQLQKGFTLIEILLVIVLIGILIAIGLVSFNSEARFIDARNDIRKTHMQTLESAITQYKLREGKYPEGLSRNYQEICDPEATGCTGFFNLKQFLVPNYLQSIPQDPNDTDTTGGTGYSIAVDETTNIVSVRLKESLREGGVIIAVNDPLPAELTTVTANTPLAATVVVNPPILCPSNYIKVPGNSLYGTSDFCVMKYEAKTGSSTVAATTQAAGTPTVNISQNDAISACNANNINGVTGYGLINNREWMTIARNIEGQLSNWTTGTAASTAISAGGLYRGHSDNSPANALAANTNDSLGYEGTGNSGFSIERRTHTLSNGETIWDMSGNVWEWTSDTILGNQKPNNSSGALWQQWTAISNYGTLSYDLVRPSNPAWNSTQNMGQYWAGTVTGTTTFAFLRGGSWNNTTNAGVFALFFRESPPATSNDIGFRCVLRSPPPNFNFNSPTLGGSIINGGNSGTVSIPYTGGLGQAHNGISISSTGVTGLTASLTSGTLADGAGSLSFNIAGTAIGAGTATFTIPDIAGATGSFTVPRICPPNYIRVPGNSLYGTSEFCVMKYEAKTGSSTVAATTQAAGTPTVNISQTNAITACNLAGGSLINNQEWMTIARNIEGVPSNWTTGTAASTAIGTGGLYRGHSDNSPSNALAANTNDSLGYEGTGNSGFSIERRTHTLSTGETIWDMSGNVWEWTSDTILGNQKPNNSSGDLWQEWTAISNYGTLSYDYLVRSINTTWNSTQNMGQYYAGTVTGTTAFAFLRGGVWSSTATAGVFTLSLFRAPSHSDNSIGFRCVLRFPPATPPAIVTNGLVLNLDAGNSASYPGTGTTWTDLSGNGNNLTWSSPAPTFTTYNNTPVISTNPTHTSLRAVRSTTYNGMRTGNGSYTVFSFFRPNQTTSSRVLVSFGPANDNCNGESIHPIGIGGNGKFAGGSCGGLGTWNNSTGVTPTTTKFWCVATTYDGTTERVYVDGVLDKSASSFTNSTPVSASNAISLGWIRNVNGASISMDASIGNIMIYNRALTFEEIQQNFWATKDRFGL